jgi:hypothetical protein
MIISNTKEYGVLGQFAFYSVFHGGKNEKELHYCPTLGGLKPPALAGSFSISCLNFRHERIPSWWA